MELSRNERSLLDAARRNPRTADPVFLVAWGVILVVGLVGELIMAPESRTWPRVSQGLTWIMIMVLLYQYTKLSNAAHSLVAKLDGSFAAETETPRTLGIGGRPPSSSSRS